MQPIRIAPFLRSLVPHVLAILALVVVSSRAEAAYRVVTTTADAGAGSLRAALTAAAAGDTIVFTLPAGPQTITLTSGELLVSVADLTIRGPGASHLTVTRSAAPATPDFSVIHVGASASATIVGLTISNGKALVGGGIRNEGALTVNQCVITGNRATQSNNGGGGIWSGAGALSISASTISNNIADGTDIPGGFGLGGGIFAASLTTTTPFFVAATTFSGNSAVFGGGVMVGQFGMTAHFVNCTFSGNTASIEGAGIGVLANGAGSANVVTVASSTFAGNTGGGGHAIQVRVQSGSAIAELRNVLLADAAPTVAGGGTLISLGYNLATDAPAGLVGIGDIVNATADVGALASNGGPTATHALLPGSAAIDAGDCSDVVGVATGVTSDQRYAPRPLADECDIGAFEADSYLTLIATTAELAGVNCANGGIRVTTGVDDGDGGATAGDGVQQPGEIDSTRYVCDGTNGTDGTTSLVSTAAEPVGANCDQGGFRIDSGLDDGAGGGAASDGMLSAGEVDVTEYVCNGVDGAAGANGSLVAIVAEPAGANCANGGQRVDAGLDDGAGGGTAGNAQLEPGEVDVSDYVCNGAPGSSGTSAPSALVTVVPETMGAACPAGGQRIDVGLDDGAGGGAAGNGQLEPGEVSQTSYVCNGVSPEPAHASGGCAVAGASPSVFAPAWMLLALAALARRRARARRP